MDDSVFERLSERQRAYLRWVYSDRLSSGEIAYRESTTSKAVDKHLLLACKTLGVGSRFIAADMFHDYEVRVERLHPKGVTFFLSQAGLWPLPWPLPSTAGPLNVMSRQQVLVWASIIAIATPAGLTVAAMVVIAIAFMLGIHT